MSGADDATPIIGQPAAERAWRGRVRCGLCGHERVQVELAADAPIDPDKRYPCLAGCRTVVDGHAVPRLSCYEVEG